MQESLFEKRSPLVNGARVKQGRELSGFTQAALANEIYVDQTMIAHIERGTKQPTSELLEAIANILKLPLSFFRQPDCLEMPKGSLLFRSKAVIGKRIISQAYEESRLALEFALRLSDRATLIPVRIASFSDPLEAATEVRSLMGVATGPVSNLLRRIERLGVLVIPLSDIRDCDAFATWGGGNREIPVIGLTSNRPPDRVRLSLAHELGHLTMHRFHKSASKENEDEAYLFASELLMPAVDIVEDLRTEKLTLFRLAELKPKWEVSMQALARRARELQVINDRQYRYLMMQISQKGWRIQEPQFKKFADDRPRAISKLIEVGFGDVVSSKRIAEVMNLGVDFVDALLSRLEWSPAVTRVAPSEYLERASTVLEFRKSGS